jgi:hypothetical protein
VLAPRIAANSGTVGCQVVSNVHLVARLDDQREEAPVSPRMADKRDWLSRWFIDRGFLREASVQPRPPDAINFSALRIEHDPKSAESIARNIFIACAFDHGESELSGAGVNSSDGDSR